MNKLLAQKIIATVICLIACIGVAFAKEMVASNPPGIILSLVSDPSVAYVLLLMGVYALIFEFVHPGIVIPGFIGLMMIGLALYGFAHLPLNYFSLALLFIGIVLMVMEMFIPSYGALGILGITAFMFGSIYLIQSDSGIQGIPFLLILAMTISNGGIIFLLLRMALTANRQPLIGGRDEILNQVGTALEDFATAGRVRVFGEIWQAKSDVPIKKDQEVRVVSIDGLWIIIKPKE